MKRYSGILGEEREHGRLVLYADVFPLESELATMREKLDRAMDMASAAREYNGLYSPAALRGDRGE